MMPAMSQTHPFVLTLLLVVREVLAKMRELGADELVLALERVDAVQHEVVRGAWRTRRILRLVSKCFPWEQHTMRGKPVPVIGGTELSFLASYTWCCIAMSLAPWACGASPCQCVAGIPRWRVVRARGAQWRVRGFADWRQHHALVPWVDKDQSGSSLQFGSPPVFTETEDAGTWQTTQRETPAVSTYIGRATHTLFLAVLPAQEPAKKRNHHPTRRAPEPSHEPNPTGKHSVVAPEPRQKGGRERSGDSQCVVVCSPFPHSLSHLHSQISQFISW